MNAIADSSSICENFKSQLKLEVYQEFSKCISLAADSVGEVSMYAFTAPMHVKNYVNQVQMGIHPGPINDRGEALLQKNFFAANRVADVVLLIEKYIIVHPDLDIFKLALSAASYDVSKNFHELHSFFLQHLPFDVDTPSGRRIENIKIFPPGLISDFDALTQRYCESVGDLGCYLGDLSTEIQQLLLSGLFANTLPKRRPADPTKKVISLDRLMVKSHRAYFLKNTEWGKNAVGTIMEVHKEFHH